MSLSYGNYGGIVTNFWIHSQWEGFLREQVKLLMITPQITLNQNKVEIFIIELITSTRKFIQNGIVLIIQTSKSSSQPTKLK